MSYVYGDYEKTIYDIDQKICQKEDELNRVYNIKENAIVKNTVIQSLNEDLVELRNRRSYYSHIMMGIMMNNCQGGCCTNGKCYKY